MGIAKLNKYFTDNCSKDAIKKIHLKELKSKIIVIDVSIYMYKFLSNGDLMENMYLFISILKNYSIIPIFIFDGKPPEEKREILMKRYIGKKQAEKECKELEESLEKELTLQGKEEMKKQILSLKKKSIRIKEKDIESVKKLMTAYGVQYLNAVQEADQLCGYLANKKNVYGCISDDMDMFMYNCKYILRHLSLLNHTAVVYDRTKICKSLNVSNKDLQDILITAGSDYNLKSNYTVVQAFNKYKEYKEMNNSDNYIEYIRNTDKSMDIEKLYKLKSLINSLKDTQISINDVNNEENKKEMKLLLEPYGFCWCK